MIFMHCVWVFIYLFSFLRIYILLNFFFIFIFVLLSFYFELFLFVMVYFCLQSAAGSALFHADYSFHCKRCLVGNLKCIGE